MAYLSTGKIADIDIHALGLSNGASITQLTNSVSGQPHGTQGDSGRRATILTGQTPANKSAAQFDGSNDEYSLGDLFSGKTEGTIYFLVSMQTLNAGHFHNSGNTSGNVNHFRYAGSGDVTNDGFGSTTRYQFDYPATANEYFVYAISTKSNLWKAYKNAEIKHTSNSNTVLFPNSAINNTYSGAAYRIGTGYYNANFRLLRFLAYDVAHTDAEVRQNIAEFSEEYQLDLGILKANFTAPTSLNVGQTLSISDGTTGGYGTKTRVWKIDGITVTPSNGDYINPTFTGLSAGNHTIRLEVTDDSGTDYEEKTVAVSSITGSATIAHGATQTYSTNVTSPVWSIVSGGGTINSSTGELTAPSSGSGLITIKATKSSDNTIYATKVVEINTRITTTSPLSAVVGVAVSGSFAADGGGGSGTWSKVSGNYPTGVSVAGNGTKSGSLTAIGTFNFRLRYVDASNPSNAVEKDFVWVVNPVPPPPPVITSITPLPYARIGHPFSFQFTKTGGSGSGTWSVISGNLPNNSVNSSGLLSISNVGNSNYNFTVRFLDTNEQYVDKAFTIPVSELAVWTFCHARPLQIEHNKAVRIFKPRQGARQTRTDSPAKRKITINTMFIGRDEEAAIIAFWQEHYPAVNFLFYDEYAEDYFEAYISTPLNESRNFTFGGVELVIEEV